MQMRSVTAAESPAEKLVNQQRTLVIGHRGFCQVAPENTLPSFKLAVTAGADMAELDYYHSKDNQLVVVHDGTLDRTTDAVKLWGTTKIAVGSKTVAELQTLDAGSWFSPQFAGTKVPTLEQALDTIQGSGGITLIERKQGDAQACVDLLKRKALLNRVVVQAFDWSYLKQYHAIEPAQVLGALGPPNLLPDGSKPDKLPKTLSLEWLDLLKDTGVKAVVWSQEVTKEAVAEAHKRGLKVWVYTINEPGLANQLLDMGVDGIITNNTSLIWRTVAIRNMEALQARNGRIAP